MGYGRIIFSLFALCMSWYLVVLSTAAATRPNIVIVLIDDVGFGDMTANWNPDSSPSNTPFLDSISSAGMRLVDFHSAASVCTPSRAALLTGRLGQRTGVTRNFIPYSVAGLPTNETTLAETFRAGGYRTGMVGKWHLGITEDYHPISRGFDSYFGLPYSNDMGCCDEPGHNHPTKDPCPKDDSLSFLFGQADDPDSIYFPAVPLLHDMEIVEQPVNLTTLADRYAEMAAKFIKDQSESKPFLLYAALTHMHVPLSFMPHNLSGSDDRSVYHKTLLEMDGTVRAISKAINETGQENNTIIWIAGDNGPWESKCDLAGDNGPFSGSWQKTMGGGGSSSKFTVWEGGHRVPGVIFWPGTIRPHGQAGSEAILSTLDIYPTIAALANISLPGDRVYDGEDITGLLLGEPHETKERVLYHPNFGRRESIPGDFGAVRFGDFKAVYNTGGPPDCHGSEGNTEFHDPPLIFNVRNDPMESQPLDKGSEQYRAIYAKVQEALDDINRSIAIDNTTIADFTEDRSAGPCCNPNHVRCRCHD